MNPRNRTYLYVQKPIARPLPEISGERLNILRTLLKFSLSEILVRSTAVKKWRTATLNKKSILCRQFLNALSFVHRGITRLGHIRASINETMDTPSDFLTFATNYVAHFCEIWIWSMARFKKHPGKSDVLIICS